MPEIVLNGCMISYREFGSGAVTIGLTSGGCWADDLAALIQTLNHLAPCYVGEYAGCRVMPLLGVKHPHLVKGLMLASCSGCDYPADITGGVDPTDPTEAAQRLAKLMPSAQYHAPVVTEAEWDANFSSSIPYPTTSNFQGERIAPVWRDFIRRMEA